MEQEEVISELGQEIKYLKNILAEREVNEFKLTENLEILQKKNLDLGNVY